MQPLQPDTSYHIFNHANGFENVFKEAENYRYFLEKYRLYISPIAETYAWCLMPNHFHLVIRIRKRNVIEELISKSKSTTTSTTTNFSKVRNFGKVEVVVEVEVEKYLSKQFANLFSCYTQSFNKVYHRMGSLFIKNFKRQPIIDRTHFLNVVVYTHRNPIHHGFCNDFDEWNYSSYPDIVGGDCSITETGKLLQITGGLDSFIEMHRINLETYRSIDDLEIT